MADWAKIKFFYETMLGSAGSTLTANSTEPSGDYDVNYIHNMLETNMWKASASTYQTILYDAGPGNTKTADYLIILGHNLNTVGAAIWLEYSDTGAWTGEEVAVVAGVTPSSDNVFLYEFAPTTGHRYWQIALAGQTGVPYMTLCIWGNKAELDYATASFDPYAQDVKAAVNLSQGGYLTGVHTRYIERSLQLRFDAADSALYGKVKAWWDTSGLKNFFVAWEGANNPDDVYLMRPDAKFNNPLNHGGAYRDITVTLKGRKE